jgi:hypothetical protein
MQNAKGVQHAKGEQRVKGVQRAKGAQPEMQLVDTPEERPGTADQGPAKKG